MKLSDLYPWKLHLLLRRYVKAHHVSRAALIAAGIAAAILFFTIGAAIRLFIGPVSLGPFAGTLANALAEALPGIAVKYDQAAVEWARDEGRVNLVILGTRIFDVDGRIIAQAPKAEIGLAAKPFLHGKIVVKRIALVGVQLTLVRTKDGGLRLGVEKDKHESDILSRITDAINANSGHASSLESFAVRNARLAFFDETTGLFVVSPQAAFLLTTVGSSLDVKLDAAVEISGRPAHVSGEFVFPPKHGKVRGTLSVTGFELGALAANSKTFAAVKDTALKLDFSTSFVTEGTHLLSADFGVDARGAFGLPGIKGEPVQVRDLRAIGRYDGASGRLLIEDATIDSDKIKARLRGTVDLVAGEDGALSDVRANLRLDRITLALPDVFASPVPFQLVDLRAGWRPATRELVLDHLGVNGKPLTLQVSGKLTLPEGQSPAIELKGTIAPIGVRDLIRYWPVVAAEGARSWAEENMFAGTVGPIAFETHISAGALDQPALPADALSVTFAVNGGEINYIKGLTHMTALQGSAKVTGASFVADVPTARIGPLIVTAAKFTIPDLNVDDEVGDITGRIQGAMPDILTLVNLPPLGYPSRFGVVPADTKGTTTLDLSVRVPMRKAVTVDEIKIGIKAAVNGLVVALGPRTQLTDGTVDFAIDNNKLHATGTTGIGGSASRLALDWTEDFKSASVSTITTRIAVKGALDEIGRAGLGLHVKDFIKGPLGVNGTLTGRRGALKQANLTFDLTPVTATFDLIGVNKPAGFPITARVVTDFGPHSVLAEATMRMSGQGTAVTATAKFDADGRLALLQAPIVRIGQLNDFALNVTRGPAGVDIAVRGRSLDGSRLAGRGSDGDE